MSKREVTYGVVTGNLLVDYIFQECTRVRRFCGNVVFLLLNITILHGLKNTSVIGSIVLHSDTWNAMIPNY